MTHKEKCKCINCKAKGSPLREIFIKDVTAEDLSNIEILDWLEGWGQVMSLSSQKFIRKYGFLLLAVKKVGDILLLKIKQLESVLAKLQDDPQWDCTDGAHPAWWRGEKYGAYKAAELIKNIMSGKETGRGAMNEPICEMRRLVLNLKQERDRLFKRCEKEENELLSALTKERDELKNRNINQAKTILDYQTGNKTTKFLLQIDELFIKVGLLEKERDELQNEIVTMQHYWKDLLNIVKERNKLRKENEYYSDRVHDLEEENGRYWERIGELEQQIKTYLIQDTDPKKILEAMISLSKPKHKTRLDGDGLNEFVDTMVKLYVWIRNKIWRKK